MASNSFPNKEYCPPIFSPSYIFSNNPMKISYDALDACMETGTEDVFVTAWMDNGAETPLQTVLPLLLLYGEYGFGERPDRESPCQSHNNPPHQNSAANTCLTKSSPPALFFGILPWATPNAFSSTLPLFPAHVNPYISPCQGGLPHPSPDGQCRRKSIRIPS